MLEFIDPRAPSARPAEPYRLGLSLRDGTPHTVGLLANGFPDSENFLSAVAAKLTQRLPQVTPRFWNKGNASIAAPESMLDEIRTSCDAVIAAYGH